MIFQASCGCKVTILDAESYYVTGIGVRGLKLGALSWCVGLLLVSTDEERLLDEDAQRGGTYSCVEARDIVVEGSMSYVQVVDEVVVG